MLAFMLTLTLRPVPLQILIWPGMLSVLSVPVRAGFRRGQMKVPSTRLPSLHYRKAGGQLGAMSPEMAQEQQCSLSWLALTRRRQVGPVLRKPPTGQISSNMLGPGILQWF